MRRSYFYSIAIISALMLAASCEKDELYSLDSIENPEVVYTKGSSSATLSSGNKNMPCGGTISTNYSDYSDHGIAKVADDSRSTYFASSHKEYKIVWNGDRAFSLKSYVIYSSDSSKKVPESWKLYGSNDNETWTRIDKREDENFTERKERREYSVSSTETYKYYMFKFKTTRSSSAIAEIKLREREVVNYDDISDLMGLIRDNTYSNVTPMGRFCENRHKTTSSDRAWLANPANEPTVAVDNGDHRWRSKNVTLYPFGTPVPADVNQHGIGDCSALAVFASIAYLYPSFIEDIITNNGNNTYTVKMYDPEGEEVDVTVSSKFLDSGVTGKNGVICWSSIFEKAIMKWNSIYHCNDMIDGIGTEHVTPLLVGNGESFAFDSGVLDYGQMDRAVNVLLNRGWIVVGGFRESGVVIGNGPCKTVSAHAFTFVFDSSTSASYGMRNPWGHSSGTEDNDARDGVAPIVNDGRTQSLIDIRTCNPGAAIEYKQPYLLPYTPPVW